MGELARTIILMAAATLLGCFPLQDSDLHLPPTTTPSTTTPPSTPGTEEPSSTEIPTDTPALSPAESPTPVPPTEIPEVTPTPDLTPTLAPDTEVPPTATPTLPPGPTTTEPPFSTATPEVTEVPTEPATPTPITTPTPLTATPEPTAADDFDGDGIPAAEDCDDLNADVYPGHGEICNGRDDDCDGTIDEDVKITYYLDEDRDTHGAPGTTTQACSLSSGLSTVSDDCDDGDANTYPGASELCDNRDNDCDGEVDNNVSTAIWYVDLDQDGWGNSSSSIETCAQPEGYSIKGGDCQDSQPLVNPGASESCNGTDDNCNAQTDEGVKITYYRDADNDTYGDLVTTTQSCSLPSGFSTNSLDCNDAVATIYPGATESCNGWDDDCDNNIDEGVKVTYYQDSDQDGYGNPSGALQACAAPDGTIPNGTDCNDLNDLVHPGATEICNGSDDNCNGQVDEGVKTTWFKDGDADGYGDLSSTSQACNQPSGFVGNSTDCDDTSAAIKPGAPETCNLKDDNCNGTTDEGVTLTWYRDVDGDGYGTSVNTTQACAAPSGYVSNALDCDDTDPDISPLSSEIFGNEIDENCDGELGQLADFDDNGYPDMVMVNNRSDTDFSSNTFVYYGSEQGYAVDFSDSLPTRAATASCVADFDNDGWLDLVITQGYAEDTVTSSYLYWGSGSGFSSLDKIDLPSLAASDCVADDLDRDGDVDLVIINQRSGSSFSVSSYVYWNDGSTLPFDTSNRESLATIGATAAVAADLNADSFRDLVITNYVDGSNTSKPTYVYMGSASGFTTRFDLDAKWVYGKATVTDLNKDGNPDIVVHNWQLDDKSAHNKTYLYFGPVSATMTRQDLDSTGSFTSRVADLNNDTWPDLLLPGNRSGGGSVGATYLYWGRSAGYDKSQRLTLNTEAAVRDVELVDVNGDRRLDLILAGTKDTDFVTDSPVYLNTGTSFPSSPSYKLSTTGPYDVDVADLNFDGYPEIVFASYTDTNFATESPVYWNSPRGVPSSHRTDLPVGQSYEILLADVGTADKDGHLDGVLDLVVSVPASYSNGASNPVYETNSYVVWGQGALTGNTFAAPSITPLPTRGAERACVADLNNDTYPDIVFPNSRGSSGRSIKSYLYFGSATGYNSSNRNDLETIGAVACLIRDFDRNGKPDIVFANYVGEGDTYSQKSYIYMNTGSSFNRLEISTVGAIGLAAGDLNRDGYDDLVVSNGYNGTTWDQDLYVYLSNAVTKGLVISSPVYRLPAHGPTGPALLEDFDDDGDIDILIAGIRDNSDYVTESYLYWNNNNVFSSIVRFTMVGASEAKADDLNGDGLLDLALAVYNDGDFSTDSMVYWGATTGYSTTNATKLATLGATGVAVVDIDLDGGLDLVFSSGSDGDKDTTSYVYYNNGALPPYNNTNRLGLNTIGAEAVTVGDLDGDGRPEILLPGFNPARTSTPSYIYWNSSRGLSNNNATLLPSSGAVQVHIVGSP